MAWGIQWLLALAAIMVCLSTTDGARKINVYQQMEVAKRSLSAHQLSRGRREDTMGLGKGEELKPGRAVKTAQGTTKVKFQETYQGLPISGASVVFEEDDNGAITGAVAGHLVAGVDEDIPDATPALSAREAFNTAALKNHDNPDAVTFDPDKDATLEVHLDDTLGDTATAMLVYRLSYRVEKQGRLSRPSFYIDANTGDIVKQWEGLSLQKLTRKRSDSGRVKSNYDFQSTGGNLKIGKAEYNGKAFPKLEITKNADGSCSLANNVARVFHCNNSWGCYDEATTPYTFDCDELSDKVNGAYSPMADALFYISATYEMFDLWYGIKDPLKRPGQENSVCGARIHFGESFENAFWDGYFITFGDGNNTFYPLTSINVVAHEIAHGITEMNSGLIYQGESGGINEAFSDMAGEAVEFYANKKQDWMVGYEIFKKPEGALRYFTTPEKDGMSIGNYKDYCPGIDVHFSSGVFNRAFFFLATTKGWDIKKAFKPFVLANVLYWMPSSRFYEAACDVVTAAKDLSYDSDAVIEAFRKVGVEPCEDTSTGVLSTSEINVPEGHEVLIHVNVTEDMEKSIEKMQIKTMGGRMAVDMKTPGSCDFCSRRTDYYGQIEVCDITPGTYELSLVAQEDVVKGLVMITGGATNILSNGTLANSNETIDFEFEMPAAVVARGAQLSVQMTTTYGYPIAVFRHGQKPNIESYEFDFATVPGEMALICNLKAGTYHAHVFLFYGQARGIDINLIEILTGKRMDEQPRITRTTSAFTLPTDAPSTNAPPEPEGSGSGSGSGADDVIDDTETGGDV